MVEKYRRILVRLKCAKRGSRNQLQETNSGRWLRVGLRDARWRMGFWAGRVQVVAKLKIIIPCTVSLALAAYPVRHGGGCVPGVTAQQPAPLLMLHCYYSAHYIEQ